MTESEGDSLLQYEEHYGSRGVFADISAAVETQSP